MTEDKIEEQSMRQVEQTYLDLKTRFETQLLRIRDSMDQDLRTTPAPEDDSEGDRLQQQLLYENNTQEIVDMHSLVQERQQNIQDISQAVNTVHLLSNKMLELTVQDGLKINQLLKTHQEHKEIVHKKIIPEVIKTKRFTGMTLKRILVLGSLSVLLIFLVIALVFKLI